GLLADATDGDRVRRGRLTSMYELASSGGIALGAVIGPLLYAAAGLWAFALLAVLYLLAGLVVLVVVPKDAARIPSPRRNSHRFRLRALAGPRLLSFLPAWIAVNAILGTWVTSQITFVLAGDRTLPGQRFPGSFADNPAALSAVLGIYVLVFSLCIVVWSFFIGRLRPLPTMIATVSGAVIASAGLLLANHGMSPAAAAPIIIAGIFLESGFTPAALTHLADISTEHAEERGLIMGAYSVALGIGYLAGNVLGGVFATWLAFDGLALLTILFAVFAIGSVLVAMRVEKRVSPGRLSTATE
ncbi:MAG: MFS transporter, partial [Brachybacterium sp.]|nr:MFS transporter [Brachybacterium sp.]